MRTIATAFVLLLALPAAAAEEPDAVYARFHRAVVSGDVEEVLRNASSRTRGEIAELPAARREASVKMLGAMMPRAITLLNKTVAPGGASARLVLSGPGGSLLDAAKSETLYGNVQMVLERGEWKVAATEWSNTPPAGLRSAAPPPAAQKAAGGKPAAVAPATAQKPAAAPRGAPVVGSINATPERKLGMAKEPCVYKPVMTAEDLENCK